MYFIFLSRMKGVRAIGHLEQACCFCLGKNREPPYLAVIYLVSPWYMVPNWPGSLRTCMSCCLM